MRGVIDTSLTRYGNPYLSLNAFINYCNALKVRVGEHEMEHYEREGVMLPRARVIQSPEYARYRHAMIRDFDDNSPRVRRPHDADAYEQLHAYPARTLDAFVHPFDRAPESSPHFERPAPGSFRPWMSYRVQVRPGSDLYVNAAEHYYAYWQVHQLHHLQQFPDYFYNHSLLVALPEDYRRTHGLPRGPGDENLRTFCGRAADYDALAAFILGHDRITTRAFSAAVEVHQVIRLNASQGRRFSARMSHLALLIAQRYQLRRDDLYDFLRFLRGLRHHYEEADRARLAREVDRDIQHQLQFIRWITGEALEQIAENVSAGRPWWVKRDIRHASKVARVTDEARDVLDVFFKGHNETAGQTGLQIGRPLARRDADELLAYCWVNHLDIVPATLSKMGAVDRGHGAFTGWSREDKYTLVKNIATGLEDLLRHVGAKRKPAWAKPRTGLVGVINGVMDSEPWQQFFEDEAKRNGGDMVGFNSESDAYSKLTVLLNDPKYTQSANTFIARNYLVACLARNLTAHTCPADDEFYGSRTGEMLTAIINSLAYTWRIAKRHRWLYPSRRRIA